MNMATKRRPEQKKTKLIPVDHAIYSLRIPPELFFTYLHAGRLRQQMNNHGQPCIGEDDLRILANSADVHGAATEWLRKMHVMNRAKDEEDEKSGRNAEYRAATHEKICAYVEHILTLAGIHASYRDHIDILGDESALTAAYVLYSRVIGLLNMACVCLKERYWESGVLLRPIDETVDLAWYFVAMEGTEQGNRHLQEWFRLNIAPSNAACREAIAKEVTRLVGEERGAAHTAAMSQVYEQKSKWVHPTYNSMVEVYRPDIPQRPDAKSGFDYGACSNAYKMFGLTDFFRSSIWTAVQGFIMCFNTRMPLRERDRQTLYSLNDTFERQLRANRGAPT